MAVTVSRALGLAAALLAATAGAFAGFMDSGSAAALPLTIASPLNGSFHTGTVSFTGTKDPDSTLHLSSPLQTDPHCIEESDGTEDWGCDLDLPNGEFTFSATEYGANFVELSAAQTVTVRVLQPPVVNDAALSAGLVSGTGYPGSPIVVSFSGPQSGSQPCAVVRADGSWSCVLPVSTSGEYSVTARQSWPGSANDVSGSSAAASITIDTSAPAVPVITRPTAGERISSQPATYAGTGEAGGRVDVFVDGAPLCSATTVNGQWSCQASDVADGDHVIQAIQWDAAGNPSGATPGVAVSFGRATFAPAKPHEHAEAPVVPVPQSTPSPTPSQSMTPEPAPNIPFLPPPVGGKSGLPPLQTWGTPTDYGASIPTPQQSWDRGNWVTGPLLGIAFVVLAALPMRLLVGMLAGRARWRLRQLAGRNRSDVDAGDEERAVFSPWLVGAGALASAAVVASLAGGLQGEVRYLRLVVAIGIGLGILNLVGVMAATKLAARWRGGSVAMRLVPGFLLVGTVSALISRTGGIQPPVIVGVVVAASLAAGMTIAARGIVAFAQLATMTALSIVAWLLHGWLGAVDGFWMSLTSESLAALCLAGLASVVLLLVPVGRFPGNTIYEWSKPVWLATALVAATFAAVVIAGSEAFPIGWMVGIAAAFAGFVVAAWSWIEFVEPRSASNPLPG